MDISEQTNLFNQAKKWVLGAGRIIREKINEPIVVETKSNANDLVTTMDKEIEVFFVHKIKKKYPDHLFFGEEGYGDEIKSLDGIIWIVDPIDGTMNFVHQKKNFAISLGIYKDGVGQIGIIYDVMADILYYGIKGRGSYKGGKKLPLLSDNIPFERTVLGLNHFWLCENNFVDEHVMQSLVKTVRGCRTVGSAALEMAYVAEGVIDGYLAMRLSPWDVAAGMVIIEGVGGIITDRDGNQIDMLRKNSVVACNKEIHLTIIENFLKKGKKQSSH